MDDPTSWFLDGRQGRREKKAKGQRAR